jgi:cysteine-rich repeat protein
MARSWILPTLILSLLFILAPGCGNDDSDSDNGVPVVLEDEADVQALFEEIGSDLAELLATAADEFARRLSNPERPGEPLAPAPLANCPDGGTLNVNPALSMVTLTACTIGGTAIDGSLTLVSVSTTGQATTIQVTGTITASGSFTGQVTITLGTFTWDPPRVCWSATGTINGTIGFAVSSSDQSCAGIGTCGDRVVTGTETCDDGNTVGGDGCSSTCQLEFSTCAAAGGAPPSCLIGEEFLGSTLPAGWTVSFLQADDWTYNVANGHLEVTGINSTIPCNKYGGQWSWVQLTRSVAPSSNFRLVVSGSWTSGGATAIQRLDVLVNGANFFCSVDDQLHTTDITVPFATGPGGASGQLPAENATGQGTFIIEQCGGQFRVFYNGRRVISGSSTASATSVVIRAGYFRVDDLSQGQACTPSGPHSTFGSIRFDHVFFESPPSATGPGVLCGF